ncbi:hypothetical protein EYC84_007830 [Monilinia fructicola]|uniref:Yippee domain-containing protein n=1 Tax=Monilinia fructicola TaxID=38448 RepID=A0A5M9JHT3_MONFR|nr:hypothetical protein EYC84_007830 [Monilinia fructicola]
MQEEGDMGKSRVKSQEVDITSNCIHLQLVPAPRTLDEQDSPSLNIIPSPTYSTLLFLWCLHSPPYLKEYNSSFSYWNDFIFFHVNLNKRNDPSTFNLRPLTFNLHHPYSYPRRPVGETKGGTPDLVFDYLNWALIGNLAFAFSSNGIISLLPSIWIINVKVHKSHLEKFIFSFLFPISISIKPYPPTALRSTYNFYTYLLLLHPSALQEYIILVLGSTRRDIIYSTTSTYSPVTNHINKYNIHKRYTTSLLPKAPLRSHNIITTPHKYTIHIYIMSSYAFSRVSSDSSSSSSSSSTSSSASYSMEPRVEVMRCSRCAKTVETISTLQYQGNELRRVSTDDASASGMVRFGHNLYYCDRCAKMVGYKDTFWKEGHGTGLGYGVWSHELVTRLIPTDTDLLQYSTTVWDIKPLSFGEKSLYTCVARYNFVMLLPTKHKGVLDVLCDCIASHHVTSPSYIYLPRQNSHHGEHSQTQYNLIIFP